MPARLPTRVTRAAPGAGDRTPSARDSALRRLSHAKRWMLVGTATLTGVLAAVAAAALPGKNVGSAMSGTASQKAVASSTGSGRAGEASRTGEASTLQAPAQEPQASVPAEGTASRGGATETPVVSGGS